MDGYVNALGLLGLTISANFTGDLFNCQLREQLVNNPLVKHVAAFLILLFFIILTSKDSFLGETKVNSWVTLKLLGTTLIIYAVFISVTKCDFTIAMTIIFVLVLVMLLNIEKSNKDDRTKLIIDEITKYVCIVAGVGLAYGVYIYYQKQLIDHKDDFSMYKFFLGTTKCTTAKV